MSLPRKEVRIYFDDDVHQVLSSICDKRGLTIAHFCEAYIANKVRNIAEESIVIADVARASGMVRKIAESRGVAAQQKVKGNGEGEEEG